MARIDLKNVSVEFPIYNVSSRSFKKNFIRLATGGSVVQDVSEHLVVSALKNISFTIQHGDRLGLIGHNGAGKSTMLRLLAGIYEPTEGDILTLGTISPMLDLMQGIQIEFTGYENIIQRGILLGLSKDAIKEKIEEISELTGLGDYLGMPMRTYSSGMMVRLAFAVSASIKPDILLIDEIFGAGDAEFMRRARAKMVDLLNESSIVIMTTHSDELIQEFCNKVILLEGGKIKFHGDPTTALKLYHEIKKDPKSFAT